MSDYHIEVFYFLTDIKSTIVTILKRTVQYIPNVA